MTLPSILPQIILGEDNTRQFKDDTRNGLSLASKVAIYAKSNGGTKCKGDAF